MDLFLGIARLVFLTIISLFLLEVLRILNRNMEPVRVKKADGPYLLLQSSGEMLGVPTERKYQLGECFIIGRNEDCSLCIENPFVSNRHAIIKKQGGEFLVFDEGSKNGTFVNQGQLPPNEGRALKKGDCISIGEISLEFHWDGEEA